MGDKIHAINGNIVVPTEQSFGWGIPSDPQEVESDGPRIILVDSNPNGVVQAPKGSLALDRGAPTIWQNTDGGTTWQFGGVSGTVPDGTAVGDMLVWNGTTWVILAAGDDGDVLTSNGPGTIPSYQPPTAGPKVGEEARSSLEYIGQGETGPTKTTTVFDGAVIAEQFVQIGDALYTNWELPDDLDRTQDIRLQVHFYLSSSADPIALGTAVSFQIQVGASDGTPLNAIIGTITAQDVVAGATWIDAHAEFALDAATYLSFVDQDALNFRIERIANAAAPEPSDGPRVHLITMYYVGG